MNMKLLNITIICWASLLCESCIGYDTPEPEPENNVKLMFRLPDEDDNDIFQENVTSVQAVIFDERGLYQETKDISRNDLAKFQGITASLTPGHTYYVVCWANIGTNTRLDNLCANSSLNNAITTYQNDNNILANGCDPAYLAPVTNTTTNKTLPAYRIDVPLTKDYTGLVNFVTAHRIFEIYVKGFRGRYNNLPLIEINGLPKALNFKREPVCDNNHERITVSVKKRTHQEDTDDKKEPVAVARIRSFYFDIKDLDKNPILINVMDTYDMGIVYSVNLEEVLKRYAPAGNSRILPICIDFEPANVEVSMPGAWDVVSIAPELR
jgi:hypothetical protein